MTSTKISNHIDYTVTPTDSDALYQLTVTIDRKPPIILQSNNSLLLARLGRVITYNHMPYDKTLRLVNIVASGQIPQGHIPNTYLYPLLAYRVVIGSVIMHGAVCSHYATAEDAFNDPLIQQDLAEAANKYGYHYDFSTYLDTVNKGLPFRLLHYTILHSRISNAGAIHGYPAPPQTATIPPKSTS